MTASVLPPLEIWGGAECTVNRVGGRYFDQLAMTGHATRASDIEDIADLGLAALRVPVLWERTRPEAGARADWRWSDDCLARCRAHAIRPMVGLLHHGSGPKHTSLIDVDFAEKFADYAGSVAQRYPWVTDWTPINEPLTTARFSCLYGHWYPHRRDDRSFATALVQQIKAIGLAMQAIRAVIPQARLVQTEDIGRTTSSPLLRYQRDYENARRWWSLDLLRGDVGVRDVLDRMLHEDPAAQRTLREVLDASMSPDVIGINHYVTSNRHLDERVERFPHVAVGGNGRHAYVDVESVRAAENRHGGFARILDEVWERYRRPIALTEVQLSCTREEQMRWLAEAWTQCLDRRAQGVEVVAVTPWALFGSVDWQSLVTREDGHYEVGAFDIRSKRPRRTALGHMIKALADQGCHDHPVLQGAGWWNRHEPDIGADRFADRHAPPILVLGASGALGQQILRQCGHRALRAIACSRATVDVTDSRSVEAAIAEHAPWAVINASGFARVERAERETARCVAVNQSGAANVALACARRSLPLLTFSSHLVFGGAGQGPHLEDDVPAPVNAYGHSKLMGETIVRNLHPRALVLRCGPFLGATDGSDFVGRALRDLASGKPFAVPADIAVSPTYLPDVAQAALDLLIDGENGIWHVCNDGSTNWLDIALQCAQRADLDARLIHAVDLAGSGKRARLPPNSVLTSQHGCLLPRWETVLDRLFAARPAVRSEPLGEVA